MSTPKEGQLINLNKADPEALTMLPGVGKDMAARIMANRPYNEIEQLLRVPGVGMRTLERIRPYLTLGTEQPLDGEDGLGADVGSGDEAASTDNPSLLERVEAFTQSSIERFQIPSQIVWFVLITAVANVLLSVILSLAILAGINRTLNFGRHATVRGMRSDISQMDTTLNNLTANLASVDQRLRAVEGLSGRMTMLENDFDLIEEDVSNAMITVDQLDEEVQRLSEDVDGMVEKVNLFDGFLEGVRELVSDLFQPVEITPSP